MTKLVTLMQLQLEDIRKIERKWQKKWKEKRVFEPSPDPTKPKFFLTVPYPYTSASLHIGHGRTYTIGDIIARYKRLIGFNVLFPMAFHITGTPIAAISDRISRGDEAAIRMYKEYVSMYEKDPRKVNEIIESFRDPYNVARYFAERIHGDFEALGYSIDWRRKFHTGEPIYNKFVEWQFYKLRERGVLKRGSHYVTFCLLHKQPEGEDDIQDADVNPVHILEYVAIKFGFEDGYILASTLRPETIFGVTNLWVNPNAKYVKLLWKGEVLYVSEEAAIKFSHQYKGIEILESISGEYFVGKYAKCPIDDRKLLILPAEFVDPDVATGFVYSEPSDAPYDYVALIQIKENPELLSKYSINIKEVQSIEPIKIIDVPGIKGHHASVIVERMGIKDQLDPRLEEATKEVYKVQYYHGMMNERAGRFAGLPVNEAKDEVKDWLLESNMAIIFHETSRKAVCRAGGKIIVARIDDQWFIDFSPEWWKNETKKWLDKMCIIPEKYKKLFYDTVDWLRERPCARKRGLGTRLPFDKEWIIESLSDSTIYMAFYTIVHYIRQNNLSPDQLKPEFFDYVFLGRGNLNEVATKTGIKKALIQRMREEFEYWYPVDQRHTGIPHITNHLTFFIMHHIAIFDEKYWPKMISLNELVIREGRKMSKSRGNVILLRHIAEKYSADLFRLYVASAADLDTVLDWREKDVKSLQSKLLRFVSLALEAAQHTISEDFGKLTIDRWFLSRFYKRLKNAREYMESMRFREFTVNMFFEMLRDISYYERRANHERLLSALKSILDKWIIVLSPIIPHIAEEIWEKLGKKGFVSLARWPEVEEELIDEEAEKIEDVVISVGEDLRELMKVMGKRQPKKCYIITAADWKYEALKFLKESIGCKVRDIGLAIRTLMNRDEFKQHGKEVAQFVNYVYKRLGGIPEYLVEKKNEISILRDAQKFLEREIGLQIEILEEEEAISRNIKRAAQALPMKPGIHFEF